MESEDKRKLHTPGHENHGAHVCHKCGWVFPNPHPSAKHRRTHKKHCGKIQGFELINASIGGARISDEDRLNKIEDLKPDEEEEGKGISDSIENGSSGVDEVRNSGNDGILESKDVDKTPEPNDLPHGNKVQCDDVESITDQMENGTQLEDHVLLCTAAKNTSTMNARTNTRSLTTSLTEHEESSSCSLLAEASFPDHSLKETDSITAQNVLDSPAITLNTDIGCYEEDDFDLDLQAMEVLPDETASNASEMDLELQKINELVDIKFPVDLINASSTVMNGFSGEASARKMGLDLKTCHPQDEQEQKELQIKLFTSMESCHVDVDAGNHLDASADLPQAGDLIGTSDNCKVRGNVDENLTVLSMPSSIPLGEVSEMKPGCKDHGIVQSNIFLISDGAEAEKELEDLEDPGHASKFEVVEGLGSDGLVANPHATIQEPLGAPTIALDGPDTGSCKIDDLSIQSECAGRECLSEMQEQFHGLSHEIMSGYQMVAADGGSVTVSDDVSRANETKNIDTGSQVFNHEETWVGYNDMVGGYRNEVFKEDGSQSNTKINSEPTSLVSKSKAPCDFGENDELEKKQELTAPTLLGSAVGPEGMNINPGHLENKSASHSDELDHQKVLHGRAIELPAGNETDHPVTQTEVQIEHIGTESCPVEQHHYEPNKIESNEVSFFYHNAKNPTVEEHMASFLDKQSCLQNSVTQEDFNTNDFPGVPFGFHDQHIKEDGDHFVRKKQPDAAFLAIDASLDSKGQTDNDEGRWGSVSDGHATYGLPILETEAPPNINTQTKYVHEFQGRKTNEEVIVKVANCSNGKSRTPLKSLLFEANLESQKKAPKAQDHNMSLSTSKKEWNSPARLPISKNERKIKGISSWVPFMCCSSID